MKSLVVACVLGFAAPAFALEMIGGGGGWDPEGGWQPDGGGGGGGGGFSYDMYDACYGCDYDNMWAAPDGFEPFDGDIVPLENIVSTGVESDMFVEVIEEWDFLQSLPMDERYQALFTGTYAVAMAAVMSDEPGVRDQAVSVALSYYNSLPPEMQADPTTSAMAGDLYLFQDTGTFTTSVMDDTNGRVEVVSGGLYFDSNDGWSVYWPWNEVFDALLSEDIDETRDYVPIVMDPSFTLPPPANELPGDGGGGSPGGLTVVAPNTCGMIYPAQGLYPNQSWSSCSGSTALWMQGDGNLVAYYNGLPTFISGTAGIPAAGFIVQGDGNVAVYSSSMQAVWYTMTNGSSNALQIGDDGNLYIIRLDDGALLWWSGSASGN